jgi:hypothetical protein
MIKIEELYNNLNWTISLFKKLRDLESIKKNLHEERSQKSEEFEFIEDHMKAALEEMDLAILGVKALIERRAAESG